MTKFTDSRPAFDVSPITKALAPRNSRLALETRILFDGAAAVLGAEALDGETGDIPEHVPQSQDDQRDAVELSLFGATDFTPMADGGDERADISITADTVEPLIGSEVSLTVVFDNDGDSVAYGPFVDLFIGRKGVDGSDVNVDEFDGLTFKNAEYLTQSVESQVYVLVDGTSANAGQIQIVGGKFTHPITGELVDVPAGFGAGDQFVVLTLPFGSFTPDQPPAEIEVVLQVSDKADPNVALKVASRGGYMFGQDSLDNPISDPILSGDLREITITPQAFTVTAVSTAPEGETATGPNFVREVVVTITPADDTSLSDRTRFHFQLPDGVVFAWSQVELEAALAGTGWVVDKMPSYDGDTTNDELVLSRAPGSTISGGPAIIRIPFYVTEKLQNGSDVIQAGTGNAVVINFTDAIRVTDGRWLGMPGSNFDIDGANRDEIPVSVTASAPTLTARSVQVIKDVHKVGETTPPDTVKPGDDLEYTLQVDISDFFRTGDVMVTDVLPDGLTFDKDTVPTLTVNWKGAGGEDYTDSVSFKPENVLVSGDGGETWVSLNAIGAEVPKNPENGETLVRFNLSRQLGDTEAAHMLGGLVSHIDGATEGAQNAWTPGSAGAGATTATIAFRAKVEEEYLTDTPLDGGVTNQNLKQRDVLAGAATVAVGILDRANHNKVADREDDSFESVSLPANKVDLSIDSITRGSDTLDPADQTLAPGDLVTYKLEYTLPIGDFENLVFDAYLPLPVFELVSGAMLQAINGDNPPAGQWSFSADTASFISDTGSTYSVIVGANNRITFDLGDSGPIDSSGERKIEIYFTAQVTDAPYADRLYLTAQGQQTDSSSTDANVSTSAISGIVLGQADVHIYKGYTGLTGEQDGAEVDETFAPGGSLESGDTLDKIGASNATDLDGGDRVKVTIAVENQGSSAKGAYNVQVRDELDSNLEITNPASLRFYRGDGTVVDSVEIYQAGVWTAVVVEGNEAQILAALHSTGPTSGVRFIDSGGEASLERGKDNQGDVVIGGKNIIYITYEASVKADVEVSSSTESKAYLMGFANAETGANFLTTPRDDNATIVFRDNSVGLVITETAGHDDTDVAEGGATADAVIGEYIDYELTINLAEATTTDGVIQVDLGNGLGLVNVADVNELGGIEITYAGFDNTTGSSIGGNAISGSGVVTVDLSMISANSFTIDLGSIINADNDNGAETITIKFRAIPLNIAGNVDGRAGSDRTVTAKFISDGAEDETDHAIVTVREPMLTATITADKTDVSADSVVEYTFKVTNISEYAAHNIEIAELLAVYLEELSIEGTPTITKGSGLVDANDLENGQLKYTIDRLEAGGVFTVTFTAKVAAGTPFGEELTVGPSVTWTSLPDVGKDLSKLVDGNTADGTERDSERTGGAGADNTYVDSDSAKVTFASPAPVLVIDATSEDSTTGPHDPDDTEDDRAAANVAIGEIVRLRLVVELPESTSTGVSIVPNLPDGLKYLGGATIAFVSDKGIRSDVLDVGGNSPLLQFEGADPSTVNPESVIQWDEATQSFILGNLDNTDRDAAPGNNEYIIIEFNVLIENIPGNQNTDKLEVTYKVRTTDAEGEPIDGPESDPIILTVVEPELSIDKKITNVDYDNPDPTSPENRGVTVEYTITLTNDSGVTAHDISLKDSLPDDAADFTVTGAPQEVEGSVGAITSNSSDGPDYTIAYLADGASVTITYTITLPDRLDLPEGTSAEATWTSLAGDSQSLVGSTTGDAGDSDGERTGDGTEDNGDEHNNYRKQDPADFGTITGKIWDDTWEQNDDRDDENEVGLAGVEVTLQKLVDGDWVAWLTTTTNANGEYEFGALPEGNYRIVAPETVENYTIDGDGDDLAPRWDVDGSTAIGVIDVTIAEGGIEDEQDFAYLRENDAPKFTVGTGDKDGVRTDIVVNVSEYDNDPDEGTTYIRPVNLLNNVWVFDRDLGVTESSGTETQDDTAIFGNGSITVTITNARANDQLILADGVDGYSSPSYIYNAETNTGTFSIALTETTTLAQVRSILEAIQYAHNGDDPTDRLLGTERTSINFEVVLNDGNNSRGTNQNSGSGGPLDAEVLGVIELAAVNDPPVAVDDANELLNTHEKVTGNVLSGKHQEPNDGVDRPGEIGRDTDPDTPFLGLAVVGIQRVEFDENGDPIQVPDTDLTISTGSSQKIVGQYGELTLHSDGTYTYDLDQDNPAVYGLAKNAVLTEAFEYTLSDGGTDPLGEDKALLVITIKGDTPDLTIVPRDDNDPDDPGNLETTGHATVYEAGLSTGSDAGNGYIHVDGEIKVTVSTGLKTLTIGDGTDAVKFDLDDLDQLSGATPGAPLEISTPYGLLEITAVSFTAGDPSAPQEITLTYTYTLLHRADNSAAGLDHGTNDDIKLLITDVNNETESGTLTIYIVDDAPVAQPDVNAVTEDDETNSATSGNVMKDGSSKDEPDTFGADGATVTGVRFEGDEAPDPADLDTPIVDGGVGAADPVEGTYGSLVINADGSYTYTVDNTQLAVQGLGVGQTLTEVFVYTITDGDGDQSTTTLTITINGTNDLVVVNVPQTDDPTDPDGVSYTPDGNVNDHVVFESALPDGTTAGSPGSADDLRVESGFTVVALDGVDPTEAVTIVYTDSDGNSATRTLTQVELEGLSTSSVTLTTQYGTLVLNGYVQNTDPASPTNGTITVGYTYTLTTAPDVDADDTSDEFTITAKDKDGDDDEKTLSIKIIDDAPKAVADENEVAEDTPSVSGNVRNGHAGTFDVADALGADGATVTGVRFEGDEAPDPADLDTPIVDGGVGAADPVEGTYGSLVINADGSYTYTVDNTQLAVQGLGVGQTLTEVFVYTITDGDGDQSTTTLTITINGTNDLVVVNVPQTDDPTDPDGVSYTPDGNVNDHVVFESALPDGTTAGSPGSADDLRVESGFTVVALDGVDPTEAVTIVYTDSDGNSATRTLTQVELEGLSTSSVTLTTQYGTLVLNGYVQNTDPASPTNGTITVGYTYTLTTAPDVDADDTSDEFTITAKDKDGDDDEKTLSIKIIDDAPKARNDGAEIHRGVTPEGGVANQATGNVYTNDIIGADGSSTSGPVTGVASRDEGDALADTVGDIGKAVEGKYGDLTLNANGSYTYVLNPDHGDVAVLLRDQFVDEIFHYTITDADGDTHTAELKITIWGNTPPVAKDDTRVTPEDTPVSGNVITGDTDGDQPDVDADTDDVVTVKQIEVDTNGDGTPDSYTVPLDRATPLEVTIEDKGKLTIGSDGSYTFEPVPDWYGEVPDITYTIYDGVDREDTAVLKITVESVVDIVPDTDTTIAGNPVTTNVLGNDKFSGENPVVSVKPGDEPSNGTVNVNPDGSITYTPNGKFVGEDTYSYTVLSGGMEETSTVTITVTNVPPAPQADAQTVPEDTPATGNVLTNDGTPGSGGVTDADGHPFELTGFTVEGKAYAPGETANIPGVGTITIGKDGNYHFVPVPDWNGKVPTIGYTVSDTYPGGEAHSTLDITVTPVVDATPDHATTDSGTPVTIDPLGNDTFSNPDARITGVTQGEFGTVELTPDGKIIYTPDSDRSGTDTFTYTVTSGGVTETTTVTVDVKPEIPEDEGTPESPDEESPEAPGGVDPGDPGSWTPTAPTTWTPGLLGNVEPTVPGVSAMMRNARSLVQGPAVAEPSVFFYGDVFNKLPRMDVPFHPIVYVNREVQVAQQMRAWGDLRRGGGNTDYVELALLESRLVSQRVAMQHILYVQGAVGESVWQSRYFSAQVDGHPTRTYLTGDGRLPTPGLYAPVMPSLPDWVRETMRRAQEAAEPSAQERPAGEPGQAAQGQTEGQAEQVPVQAARTPNTDDAANDLVFGAARSGAAPDGALLNGEAFDDDAEIMPLGAPSFTAQLQSGSSHLPSALRAPLDGNSV